MRRRRWTVLVRAALVGALCVFALVTVAGPQDGDLAAFFNLWVYNGLLVAACAVTAARAVLVRRERPAWTAFAVGMGAWAFGEIWYAAVQPETFPSVADLGFLGFYPLAYVGIVLLLHSQGRAISATLWVDGAIASLTGAALAAAVLFELVLRTTSGSPATVATNLAYPIGDLLLLSAVFGVFSLAGGRPGSRWPLLAAGLVSTALADSIYLFQTAAGTYVEGTWIDVFWPTALVLVAVAAWMPERVAELDVRGRPLFAVPAACALVSIFLLVYDHFVPINVLALGLATASVLGIVLRLALTFRENGRLYALTRHEAVTDALTGLGNRRKLLADLERELHQPEVEPTLLMVFDLDGFKSYNDTFGHPAGDALLARLGQKLADVPGRRGAAYRLGGDEFCLVVPVATDEVEQLIDRACAALTEHGQGFEVVSSFGAVLLPEEAAEASRALSVADERLYAQKHSRRADGERTAQALLAVLSVHEPALAVHLEGVVSLAVETGRILGLRRDELDELARAAQLHDLGKLAVPDEILHRTGALDAREWAFVRQHTLVGERILRASPALRSIAGIVRSTHERWDGAGYPDRLAGEEIPLAARIISACDAYDAMTSRRPYRPALSPAAALEEIEALAGTQFDPTVARVLAQHVREQLEAARAA
jgi:diguanylate cyclase (GGDEF)-like protein